MDTDSEKEIFIDGERDNLPLHQEKSCRSEGIIHGKEDESVSGMW